jgi:hypothetical protein
MSVDRIADRYGRRKQATVPLRSMVGQASRLSINDGQDAHPTEAISLIGHLFGRRYTRRALQSERTMIQF